MKLGNKSTVLINWTYYMLCLAAFIWQSTLISVNYFKYDTVSTVNFIPPGTENLKPLTVCFKLHQVMNVTIFNTICDSQPELFKGMMLCYNNSHGPWDSGEDSRKLWVLDGFFSMADRFKIMINQESVMDKKQYTFFPPYMLGIYVCYRQVVEDIKPRKYNWYGDITALEEERIASYNLGTNYSLKNITQYRLAFSEVDTLPHFELFTTPIQESNRIRISTYYYRIKKLKPPYVNQCLEYKILGFLNRFDSVNDCINRKFIRTQNSTTRAKIYTSDLGLGSNLLSYIWGTPDREDIETCYGNNPYVDCDSELSYTDINHNDGSNRMFQGIYINQILSKKPSYISTNSEQIDDVDYVTYILGAAGTWFGFSFMTIEPVIILEWLVSKIILKLTIRKNAIAIEGEENTAEKEQDIPLMLLQRQKINMLNKKVRILNDNMDRMNHESMADRGKLNIFINQQEQEISLLKNNIRVLLNRIK